MLSWASSASCQLAPMTSAGWQPAVRHHASKNPKLSKLWSGNFFRLDTLQILRIKSGYYCLSVVFRNDVRGQ